MDWIKHRYYLEALEKVKMYSASLAEAKREIESLKIDNVKLRSELPSSHEREFGTRNRMG